MERQAAELVVDVVGGFVQRGRVVAFVRFDHLVGDLSACRDDDDEHPVAVEPHEIDVLESRRLAGRRQGEAHVVRGAGQFLRRVFEQVVDGSGAAKPGLDVRKRTLALA